jgi:hypothetical protein
MQLAQSMDKGIRFVVQIVDISYPCRKIDHHSDFSSNSEESEQRNYHIDSDMDSHFKSDSVLHKNITPSTRENCTIDN